MNLSKLLVLLIIALLLTITATALFYSFYYVIDIKETGAKLMIADFVGIDVNPVNLTFGAVQPGGAGYRAFIVKNVYHMPVAVKVQLNGEVARFVTLSNSSFVLRDGQENTVQGIATVPQNALNGTYYGRLRVIVTRNW